MKKRILSLLCVFCLMLTMLPTSAFAAEYDAPTLSIEASYDSASNKVTAKVILGACSDLGGLDFHMKYDLDKLAVESIVGNEEFGSEDYTTISDNTATTKDIGLTFVKSSGMTVTGTKLVFTATFSVKPGQTGDAQFAFDDYYTNFSHKNGEDTASTPAAGSVTTTTVTIPKAPITSVTIADLDDPVKGAAPDTSVTVTPSSLAADVKWFDGATPVAGNFAANTAYTVKIKLTASGGDNFAETVTAGDYTVIRNSETELLLTKTFDATAIKDTPTINTVPTASAITFGQKLSNSTLTGGEAKVGSAVISGTFKWKTGTTAPQVKDSNSTEYEVVFTPTDTASYESATCKVKLTVNKKTLSSLATTPISDQPYTGFPITPTFNVMNGTNFYEILDPSDYKVTFTNNTNIGTANYTIEETPTGNYKFNTSYGTFKIKAADSSISITGDPSKPYDGNVVTDPAVSKSGSTGAVTYTYYTDAACTTKTTTASGAASDGAAPKNAGDYWVKATLAADSNHDSATSVAKKFTISQKALTDSMITLGTQKTYNGTEQGVALSSDSIKDGTVSLIGAGKDYSIVRGNKATDVGDNTLVIKGEGNYTGEACATWSLVAKEVTITPDAKSKTYGAAEPTLTYTTDIDGDTTLKAKFDGAKSGALSYTGTDVGSYDIEIGTLKAGKNFTLKMVTPAVKFTINHATPSITATSPRQLVKNDVEVDITGWASFNNTDSGAKLTYALDGAPTGITLTADNKLKAANDASTVSTFNIKVNAAATTNFAAPTEKVIVVNVVTKADAGVSITGAPTSKTYGDADFTLTATKTAPDGGTWRWNSSNPAILEIVSGADTATPTIKVKKADTTGATLTVTYTSSTHYGSANATITVAPKTLTAADLTHSGPITKVYDTNTNAPTGLTVSVKSGSLVGTDTLAVTGTLKYNSANVNEANKITFTPDAITTGNYALAASQVLTITGAKITQATPTYTVPTGLTAKYGQTLADVNIAATTGWSWMNTGTAVGTPATKNFPAKFTPTDAINYKTVENIDVSVAVSKADAPTLTNITVSQKYTVDTEQSKNIGTADMPADAGTLTYTAGSSSVTTGTATVSSFTVDSTGMVKYTITGGADGAVINLPVTIDSDNYAGATVNVVITLTAKDSQAALTLTGGTTVVYGQTLQLGTSGGSGTGAVTYAVTNGTGEATIDATGKLTPVKVGTVKVKATKDGDASYNSITSAEVEIHITRATPTGAPKYTAITTSGKTLADAGLTTAGSTLNPNAGTLVWVDNAGTVLPDTIAVAANTTYNWLFTPTDTNYTTLTGSIELYHKSSSGGGGWYYTYYTIKATAGTNGSISPSGWTSVRDGRDQTFTITPDKGYAVAKVLVDGKSVGAVKSYTFKNVTKDHTIEAIFMKSNGNPQTGVFVDVAEGSYYEEAIDWAVEKGITNGVSSNMFAPNDPCTRAQIVTFLWRTAGSPAPKSMSSFTDVPADAFYAKAVAWAVENGITSGTGESKFSPNATCTRAQAVTFLYRASGSPAVSGSAEFSDVATNAYYADAVAWAAKKGITTGIGGGLFGSDNDCTRGQIVTFLWRAMAE